MGRAADIHRQDIPFSHCGYGARGGGVWGRSVGSGGGVGVGGGHGIGGRIIQQAVEHLHGTRVVQVEGGEPVQGRLLLLL